MLCMTKKKMNLKVDTTYNPVMIVNFYLSIMNCRIATLLFLWKMEY